MPTDESDVLKMTTEIVVAFLSKNAATASEVTDLVKSLRAAFLQFPGQGSQASEEAASPKFDQLPKPAIPASDSISPDGLICLECGRKQKSLKLHLMRAHDLAPQAYRAKWGLPFDYPMVAPNLSARRKTLANESGFLQHQRRELRRAAK